MHWASEYVLEEEDDVYEKVSDDEYDRGMSVSSDSDSDEEKEKEATDLLDLANNAPSGQDGTHQVLGTNVLLGSPPGSKGYGKRPRKKSHWKRFLGLASEPAGHSKTDKEVQDGLNKRWFRRADTNVVSVKFDTLLSPGNMHAGEVIQCGQCGAVLSHISKLRTQGEDKVWCCDFCGQSMVVDVEEEEMPKVEDVTYLLEPAASTTSTTLSGVDQSLVLFVVDTSGSMCVTTEVEGSIRLRGTAHLQRLQSFNLEGEDQFLPSQRHRNVTYISRLQAMQAAVDHQLDEMSRHHRDRRVGLVVFNSEVSFIGDGSQDEVTFAGDKLTDTEQLKKEASDLRMSQPIHASRKLLGEKVYKLEEGGSTALGPALVVAVNMAAQHPGSKVILCTDGKANIGLGKLEESSDETSAMEFYAGVGDSAVQHGVTVSVITISGTDCKLVHLGQLADKTGGQVNIVDPLKLREEFSNILADPIIATKVKATFLLYKDLYVVDETHPDKQECKAEQQVGNVSSSSVVTFQFAHRKGQEQCKFTKGEEKGEEKAEASLPKPAETTEQPGASASSAAEVSEESKGGGEGVSKDLPFQLQIEYVDQEGNKALRVLTQHKPLTRDRQLAEQNANLEILGAHASKMSADLALQGQYSRSRGIALMNQRLAWRSSKSDTSTKEIRSKYKNIFGRLKTVENRLGEQQQYERSVTGHTYSDESGSDDDDFAVPPTLAAPATKGFSAPVRGSNSTNSKKLLKKMHFSRTSEMDDNTARMIFNLGRHRSVDMPVRGATSSSKGPEQADKMEREEQSD